ncbi:MAG: tandem-95 repeat protein [Rhizobiales bacterium]|nr:tandem-95 repeat protein [Hyphomicrobiales bacterium]
MDGGKLLGRLLTSSALWRVEAPMAPDGAGSAGHQPARPVRPARLAGLTVLEPRVLFDAALGDTLDQAADSVNTDDIQPVPLYDDVLIAALVGPGTPDLPPPPVSIAFVDAQVEGYGQIIAELPVNAEVHLLTAEADGLSQMAQVLSGRSNIAAVHIISHGTAGSLTLGSATLTAETMSGEHADELSVIAASLSPDADIMIYGCDFGAGEQGVEAVNLLAALTGADVAASSDDTGAAVQGGDWDLEETVGVIDTASLAAPGWDGLLTKSVINAAGGALADGSDGLRIHVMTNGQYQITYHGANQLYNATLADTSVNIFNGIYMAVGSTVVGPGTTSGGAEANAPGQIAGDVTFRELSQTSTGAGSATNPYRVTTSLYYNAGGTTAYEAASDYKVDVVTEYVYPNGYMTLNVTVTPPPSNAQPIKIYHSLDTFLAGGDNGPAFSLPQNLASTNNTTGNPSLVAVRKDPGGPNDSFVGFAEAQGGREFDYWYSAAYDGTNLYAAGMNNGGDIINTWNTNAATDNGVAVQFTLGAVNTVQTWSYLVSFTSEATIDLDADNSSGATGSAYQATYNMGSGATIPVVDTDAHIANVTGDIQQVRATLSNAQAGDSLTINAGALPVGVQIVSQTGSQIVLGAVGVPQTEATFDLALHALGFTTSSSSLSARTVNFAVTNELGVEGFASASTIGINQPPAAHADVIYGDPATLLTGNLFANNGNGADADPEADPFAITAINGAAFTVGVPITLSHGTLTITNAATGAFTFLASNSSVADQPFTYTITDSDGGTSTATVNLNPDADGDGVSNAVDIDDDNDGILDTTEQIPFGPELVVNGSVSSTASWASTRPATAGLNTGVITEIGDTDGTGPLGTTIYNTTPIHIINGATYDFSFLAAQSSGNAILANAHWVLFDVATPAINQTIGPMMSTGGSGTATGTLLPFTWTPYNSSLTASLPTGDYRLALVWDVGGTGAARDILIDDVSLRQTNLVRDTDADGISDHLDIDSDNDGITDNVEAQATAGYLAPSGTDTDHDGLDNAYDATTSAGAGGSNGLSPVNTDGADTPDYIDSDSDNQGAADIVERGDGQATSITSTTDTDGDGLLDIFEGSDANDGFDVNDQNLNGAIFTLADSDNDTAATGAGAVPLTSDLDYRDNITPPNLPPVVDLDGALPLSNGTLPATPPDNAWQVALYGGHFGVPGSINPTSVAENGAPGVPTLHGVGYAPQGSITFNDPNIPITDNPRDSLIASGFSYAANPVNGDYTPGNGVWAMVMSRTLTQDATIVVGAPGQYFDDHAELFINGVKVDTIIGWYPSLPASEVISYAASAGDVVEIRLTNVNGLGGFNVSLNTAEQPNDLDYSATFTEGGTPVAVTLQTRAIVADAENAITSLSIAAAGIMNGAAEHVTIAGQDFDLATTASHAVTVGGTALAISYDAATQAFTVQNAAGASLPMELADLDAMLRSITYENTSEGATAGDRTLTFTVTDAGGLTSAPAVSTITVIPVNDGPVAVADSIVTLEDSFAVIDVTANDVDLDGDVLTVTEINGQAISIGGPAVAVAHGGVTLDAAGRVVFTPSMDYFGTTTFACTIDDGHGGTATAGVIADVQPVNDAPVAIINQIGTGDLIVVDSAVPDAAGLIAALPPDATVIVIPTGVDGVEYLAQALTAFSDIPALHVLSHGDTGALHLGTSRLDVASISSTYQDLLARIGTHMSAAGDILVYGCNFGQNDAAVAAMAAATQADIAASTDNTGGAAGDNWLLEKVSGAVESTAIAAPAWGGELTLKNTGAWTVAGNTATESSTGITTTITFAPVSGNAAFNTISAQTFNTINAFNAASVQGAASLGFVFVWDNTPEGPVSAASTDAGTGTVTITFSKPVTDPIINIDRVGGLGGSSTNSSLWTVTTPGATLSKVSGSSSLNVTATQFNRTVGGTSVNTESSLTDGTGTAAGSIRVNGTYSTLTFSLTGTGVEGAGSDGVEIGLTLNVNQTPSASATTYTTAEDTPKALTGVSFGDVDAAAGNVTVTLSVLHGTLDINTSVGGGVTAGQVTGDNSGTITITAPLSAINATLANASGLLYTPTLNYTGSDTLTAAINDNGNTGAGGPLSAATTAPIVITPVNDAPIDGNEAATVTEDQTLTVAALSGLLANTTDVDGGTASVTQFVISGTTHPVSSGSPGVAVLPEGTLTIRADGSYTFAPASNYAGALPLVTYMVADGAGGTATSTLTLSMQAVNDPPLIDLDGNNSSGATNADYVATYIENAPGIAIADGADLIISDVDNAIVEMTVTLTDGKVGDTFNFPSSLPGGVTASIVPAATLTTAGPLTVTFTGSPTTTAADWQAILASVTLLPSTNNVNNPDPADRHITVQVSDDSSATSNIAASTIHVVPQNDPPTLDLDDDNSGGINAGNVLVQYTENAAATPLNSIIVTSDLDDTNYESATVVHTNPQPGDQISVNGVIVSDGSSGTVAGIAYIVTTNISGQLVISFSGTATLANYKTALESVSFANSSDNPATVQRDITFQVNDGLDNSPLRHAYVNVTAVNDPPVGSPIPQQAGADAAALTPLDAASYFTDPDNATLTYSLAPGAPAWLSINPATGVISGTPPHDASTTTNGSTPGVWDVTVIASDGGTPNLSGSVALSYAITNPSPVAQDDEFSVTEGTVLPAQNVFAANGSGLDADPDGDTFSVSAVGGLAGQVGTPTAGSAGGLFTIASDGTVTFTESGQFEDLATGETRDTTITYEITDSDGGTSTATVTITVTGTNDQPTVTAALANVAGADAGVVAGIDVSGTFSDADSSDVLAYSATGLPAGLSIDPATGIISGTIAPSASQNGNTGAPDAGVYAVVVTASDGHGGIISDNFTYTISNPPPVAQDDTFSGDENTVATGGNVLASNGSGPDSDPDGDALHVGDVDGSPADVGVPVAGSSGGFFTIASDGSLTFDPNGDFESLAAGESVTTSVSYQVSDNEGGISTATVTYTVTGVNDAPMPLNPLDPGTPPADPNAFIPQQAGNDGAAATPLDVSLYAHDPDASDTLTFSLNPAELPPGLTFDGTTVTGTYDAAASQGGPAGDGVYPVTLTVSDGHGGSFMTVIVFTVGNPPPVAQDDAVSAGEDTSFTGSVFANNGSGVDSDPDSDAFTVTAVGGNAVGVGTAVPGTGGGLFTVAANGDFTFDPGTDFNGLDIGETAQSTVTYTITDAEGATSTATVTVSIVGANDTPVVIDPSNPGTPDNPAPAADPLNIIPDVAATDGATPAPVDVGSFLADPDGEPLSFTATGLPPGMVIDPATGIISGTLPADASQAGPYTVTVTATDPDGASVQTTVTYTVSNLPPLAVDDTASVGEDSANVSGNVITGAGADADTAPDADPLTVAAAVQGASPVTIGTPFTTSGGGVLTLNADGSYSFVPGTAYNGLDAGETATETITYTIDDGNGGTATATLVITVAGANDTPVVIDPSNPGTPDNPVPAADPLNIIPDVAATDGATPAPVDVGSFLADPDGEPLSFTATGLPPGMVIDPATGIISGTLPADASQAGPYTVTVTATDPDGASVQTTVTYTVSNLPPLAVDDTASVGEDSANVSGNVITGAGADADTAPDADPLTVAAAVQGASPVTIGTPFTTAGGGVLTLNADGSYSFVPGTAYNGLDAGETATETITYTIDDGNGGTATATLVITVAGANDTPVVIDPSNPGTPDNPVPAADPLNIIPDVAATDGATPAPVDVGSFLADPDGEPLSFTATGLPPGMVIDPATGIISGTLPADASQAGPYTVTVTATDPDGASVQTTVTYTVSNLPPLAVDDTASVGEDSANVSGNVITGAGADADTAPDADPLTVAAAVQGASPVTIGTPFTTAGGGVLTLNADGSYSFVPGTAYNGLDAGETATETITYTIDDGNGGTATATLVITVAGANDTPVVIDPSNPGTPDNPVPAADPLNIIPDVAATDGATPAPVDVGSFLADPDGEPLSFTATGLPPGMVIDPATGIISGTLPADASQAGPYTVTVTATDPDGASVQTTVTYTVSNLPPLAVDDTASVGEDSANVSGNVITGAGADADTAPDADPLTVAAAVQGASPVTIGTPFTTAGGGVLTLNADGSYSFVPGTAYNGLDAGETATETITYTIDDGNGGTATATLVITVAGANDTPVVIDPSNPGTPDNPVPAADPLNIIPDVAATDGATPAPVDVGSFLADPDGEPLSFTATGLPPGMVIDPATGIISGTLPADASQAGPYTVTVTATDPDGASVQTTVTYTVSNLPPLAVDDSSTNTEDTPQSGNVLTDPATGDADTGPDSDPLFVTMLNGQPVGAVTPATIVLTHGTLVMQANGTWSFQPNSTANTLAVGEVVIETVTYTVSDGNGGTDTATLDIEITGVNDAPVTLAPAADQAANEGDSVTTPVAQLFGDPDSSDTLTFSATGLPAGLVIDPATGVISGTVALGASADGPYTVTITADDGHGGTASLTFAWEVIMPAAPMPGPSPSPEQLPPIDAGRTAPADIVISEMVNDLGDLHGTPDLGHDVILNAVEGLASLNSAADLGRGDDIIGRLVEWAQRQGRRASWMHQLLDDLAVHPYIGDSISLALSLADHPMLTVKTLIKNDALFVGIDKLDHGVTVTGITGPHGEALPDTVAVIDSQTLVVNIRPDRQPLQLMIHASDGTGRSLRWPIMVNPTSSEAEPDAGSGDHISALIEDMRMQIARIARHEGPPVEMALAAE